VLTPGMATWAYRTSSAKSARNTERMNTARDGGVSQKYAMEIAPQLQMITLAPCLADGERDRTALNARASCKGTKTRLRRSLITGPTEKEGPIWPNVLPHTVDAL
jgi:hypothetical protein